MGLLAEPESPRWIYRLTHRGEALAKAFAESIETTTYSQMLAQQSELSSLAHHIATEYGQHACLCPEAMSQSTDRELLLDPFFHFDQQGSKNPHTRRRLTMGRLLDLVNHAKDVPLRDAIRRVLYLGWYDAENAYQPHTALQQWYQRWRFTQTRHCYTATLQTLWAIFLDHLHEAEQISFKEFINHVERFPPEGVADIPLSAYVTQLCMAVHQEGEWQQAASDFHTACQVGTE